MIIGRFKEDDHLLLRLEQVQIVVALIALVTIILFLGSSVPYWNRVLAYARGEDRKVAD
jgi:hypothetical protein